MIDTVLTPSPRVCLPGLRGLFILSRFLLDLAHELLDHEIDQRVVTLQVRGEGHGILSQLYADRG
jgi:hypothetical protein